MPLLPDLAPHVYAIALFSAACLGFSKAGFPGLAMLNVLLMAELFGAKASVGIILPLLIFCDVTVYPLFHRYASWRATWPLLLPTLAGVAAGYLFLDHISDLAARRALGAIILLMTGLQLLREQREHFLASLKHAPSFLVGSGLAMGVSTMMANAAGPAYSIYALVKGMSKHDFLGIGARAFLLINLVKVPLMADLDLIHLDSLKLDLLLVPGLLAGIFLGRALIERIPQRLFEILLYLFCLLAGLRMLLH